MLKIIQIKILLISYIQIQTVLQKIMIYLIKFNQS